MAARALCLPLLLLLHCCCAHAQAHGYVVETVTAHAPRPTVAAIALSIRSRAIQDSRCYLMNGGAVESFFISEDTPVGSVIGTLSVNGDASDVDGNISLRLQEKNAAVGIAPGSKNLTLLRALDREEKTGPSNVYVNVRCDRRRTSDPSFIIPVSVRVWDVNDNAPRWPEASFRARLSEQAAPGARVLTARASDADQPGPHATVHYSVLPGPYSDYLEYPNELDSVLVVKKPLDYETVRNFSVTLRAQDQGSPALHSDALLTVEVLDADDHNPKFEHDHYTAVLPDDVQEGTILETSPGPVAARDQDKGINAPLHYSVTGEGRALVAIDKDTGRLAATARLLTAALPATVVLKATQVDNADRYALATLSIAGGSAQLARTPVRFSRREYTALVPEDTAPGSVLALLHTEPTRSRDLPPLQFYVSDRLFLDKFAINSAGEVLLRKSLDYEAQELYLYQVMVTDGVANDTASINITVVDVNEWEPRFKYPQYEFRLDDAPGGRDGEGEGEGGLLPVGKLDVYDGDKPDTVTLTLRGSDASMFYINSSGEMFLRQEVLPSLNTSVLHVVATAIDSGAPPRQTSVPVIVHVGARLVAATSGGAAGPAGVVGVFAGALSLLAVLVCVLLAYICRNRRRSKSSSNSPSKPHGFVTHEKPLSPAALPPAPHAGVTGGSRDPPREPAGGSGSLLSVSAGASTILANSSSSLDLRGDTLPTSANGTRSATVGRQSQRFPTKSKVAPQPPTLEAPGGVGGPPSGAGGPALMSDHLQARGAGRSGVAWPSAVIPARVKKLSWDDTDCDTEHDKGSSGRPLEASNPALHDHMNLTVYF